jgi:predicted transcriptional regulator
MRPPHTGRLLLLIGLAVLAALVLTQGHASAQTVHPGDWTVNNDTRYAGESILVGGRLVIEFTGRLELVGCTLLLTNSTQGANIIDVRGVLVLDGTTVSAASHGSISIEGMGSLVVTGPVELEKLDVSVGATGAMDVSSADLTLTGSSPTEPSRLDVVGRLGVRGSDLTLSHALLRSIGSVNINGSRLIGENWGTGPYQRAQFLDGSVAARDSTFKELYNGILVQTIFAAEGCTFTRADLLGTYSASTNHPFKVSLVGCSLSVSTVSISVPAQVPGPVELDVLLRNVTIDDGRFEFNSTRSVDGSVLLDGVSIVTEDDYAVRVRGSGDMGTVTLRGLDLQGPYGIHADEYFEGLVIDDSKVNADLVALYVSGNVGRQPMTVTGLRVEGAAMGIKVAHANIEATGCDLTGAAVPIWLGDDASASLDDCLLVEGTARLEPVTAGATARLAVQRTVVIGAARWLVAGHPVASGVVMLDARNSSMIADFITQWTIGTTDFPLVRILEWNASRDAMGILGQRRIAFHELLGQIEVGSHVFKTPAAVDPWVSGPIDLWFEDDAKPEVTLDGSPFRTVSEPQVRLRGRASDVGTGLDLVRWVLETPLGEEVTSGALELSEGRWATVIDITANRLVVRIEVWDLADNYNFVQTSGVFVNVTPPTLTVLSPRDGEVTNDPHVTVSGSVDGYGDRVEIHIGDQDVDVPVDADGFFYTTSLTLPYDGMVEVFLTAFDPFGNSDSERVTLYLDSSPPTLDFVGLEQDGEPNYVRVQSLVIEGRTDDPKARIWVDDQPVGVLQDRSFAATVQLREGRQTVRVLARDDAGNPARADLVMVLDTVPPVLTLADPSTNPFYTNQDTVEVIIESSEPVVRATRDGVPVAMPGGRMSFSHEFLQDGRREFLVRASDLAGNEGALVVAVVRDIVEPRLTLISPKSGDVINTASVDLLVHVSEGGCALLVDGERLDATDIGAGRMRATLTMRGGDGVKVLLLRAEDLAGNPGEARLMLDLDTTAPSIGLIGLSDGARVTTEPLEVRGTTEARAKVVWVNDVMADLEPDGSFRATLRLKEGRQEIRVKAIDRANNPNDKSVVVEVLAAPNLEIPWQAAAAGTILFVLGAVLASTEVGRWGLLTLFLPLYTKLRKDRILDQRTRGLIQGYIMANPGCNYTLLRDNLDLADGTLTYHLQVLEREEFVYSIREGLFRCFYPTGLPPPRRGKLHLSDTQADIIRICKRIPGITVGEIATAMNRRPNVISYHLKLLRDGGLVTLEEDGRHVRVYPVDTAVAMI